MPIYATLTGVSSNKPEGKLKIGKIPLQKISYLPVKGQVAVLKPIIDKISITYIGDPNLTPVLVQNLKQETEAGVCWQMAPWKNGPVLYQATADLVTPAGGSVARLQVGPKKKGLSYTLRLEFNPTALGKPGIAFLKQQLEALVLDGLSFAKVMTDGRVTRLDVAVDIVGVNISDLLVNVQTSGKQHWYYSANGKQETGYFGIVKGDNNAKWKAYNKRQQLKDTTETPVAQADGGLSHTRLEYTYTPMKPLPLLGDLPNRFTEVSVAYPTAPKGIKHHDWAFFVDSCSRRGEAAALALMPEGKTRNRYQNALKIAHAEFWRPAKIWEAWPAPILNVGLVHT